jgi:hypothetical protein
MTVEADVPVRLLGAADQPVEWPQLLPVVVRIRLLELGTDLGDPAGDLLGIATTVDDGGLVLSPNIGRNSRTMGSLTRTSRSAR